MQVLPFMMAAAGGIGAISTIQSGNAAKSAANQQAVLDRQMGNVYATAGEDEARQRLLETATIAGKQTSGYAGGGVSISGTPLQTAQDTAAYGAQQVAKARFTGNFEQWKSNVNADQAVYGGKVAQQGSRIGAAMGLLTTGMNIASLQYIKNSGGTQPKTALGS